MHPRLIIDDNTVNFDDPRLAAHAREAIFTLLVEHSAVFRVRAGETGEATILASPSRSVKFLDTAESRAADVTDEWVDATVRLTLLLGTFTLVNEEEAYELAAQIDDAVDAE